MLKEEIRKLIALKQEGPFWDFKKQWYSSNSKMNLLHDLICVANNLEDRDAYIIIGSVSSTISLYYIEFKVFY